MRKLIALVVLLLWSGVGVSSAQAQPAGLSRLVASDFEYLGKSPLPASCNPNGQWTGDATSTQYGSGYLSLGPKGGIVTAGHAYHQRIAEYSIPSPGGAITVMTPCHQVTGLSQIDSGSTSLAGTLYYNNRLIVAGFSYYDADANAYKSHAAINPANLQITAWQQVGGIGGGYVGGYMAHVPQEWQAALGGPAVTGQGTIPIISRANHGPGLASFNPDQITGAGTAPVKWLTWYPMSFPLANGNERNPWMLRVDGYAGVAIIPGTSTTVFGHSHGDGPPCYGEGAACGDPVQGSKGEHAFPYICQLLAYDTYEMAEAVAGTRQPYSLRPYAVIKLPAMDGGTGRCGLSGLVYQPTTKRLLILQHDKDQKPWLYQYAVKAPGSIPNQDCKPGTWALTSFTEYGACVNGFQTREETFTRSGDVPATGTGRACESPTKTGRSAPQACTVTGPAVPATFVCTQTYAYTPTAGWTLTGSCK